MGLEGKASNEYWKSVKYFVPDEIGFDQRTKKPTDMLNSMLNYGYAILASEITKSILKSGLDPYCGFLHFDRYKRTSLTFDLIEPFRQQIVDKSMISLINRKQIEPKHFVEKGQDNIIMTDDGKKIILSAWQNRKKEEILHPYLQDKVPVGLLPYIQAMLMARFLRNDSDSYPVFLMQ